MNKICRVENYLFCLVLFCILFGFVCSIESVYTPDLRYLYNRAYQMYTCFLDGNLPWFYYNDFNGVGYGSSFFYGQLTLFPFLPLVPKGISVFVNSYVFVTIIVNYIGVSIFTKRFMQNNNWMALLYCSSTFSYYTFLGSGTYSNLLGIGLSFIFLAFCVDFFRDNKSYIKAGLMFYLIFNTHLISALLSFILCVLLMLYYWNKQNFKLYLKFALFVCVLCSYNIFNILYHSDILNRMSDINTNIIKGFQLEQGKYVSSILYLSSIPFGGLLSNLLLGDLANGGYHYFNWVVLVIGLYFLIKNNKSFSLKWYILIVLMIMSSIVSLKYVWFWLNSLISIPIQFPCRFAPYIIVLFFVLCFRFVKKENLFLILFLTCLPDLFFGSFFTWKAPNTVVTEYETQIINGEYLDKSFVFNMEEFERNSTLVVDMKNNHYDFYKEKEKLYIPIKDKITTSLQVPKLYYNGYVCYDKETGIKLEIKKGYSQFITITLDNFTGTLVVEYKHPLWLKVLFFIDLFIWLYFLVRIIKVYLYKMKP